MKKLMMLCGLIMGLATAVGAQTAGVNSSEKAKELQKQLKLTDKQTTKISAIYEESSQKFEKIKKEEHGDNVKMMVAIKPLRTETIKKIRAELTPVQKAKYDKLLTNKAKPGGLAWGEGWSSPASE
ncbi:hypothetical protein [Mucilaginibacter pocheonensis]|uniref:Spy/CpxP family protein refolding chaperone n=1 Tax=Mucilaginibacter pocheonensis TaxID=398050 RepID=A0ABU1TFL0_9SPHI|nr:hypothetical protein [Mucilaginibacter pocheonensis]MDR6944197.1 Spy/CpxP family protein refolding chaperone [Mucilaginibacter pocheonensis]